MADRQTILSIDLGGEQVQVKRVEATEMLGRPFAISVDFVAPLGEIDLLPHLGKLAGVTVFQDDRLMRYFHGVVVEGEFLAEQDSGFHYRLSLRPWTHLMSQNKNFAIFQKMTVIDIAKAIFGKSGIAKFDASRLNKTRVKRGYCVQYGESDFTFVTRLLEEEGIYYFYEHSADKHEMILCEAPTNHKDGKPPQLTYNPHSDSVANVDSAARTLAAKKDFISRWNERVASGGQSKVTMRDFNFKTADKPIEVKQESDNQHPDDENEVYEFPGRYRTESDGKPLSEARLGAFRANRQTYSGETQVSSLCCGQAFKLVKHPHDRFNKRYLITRTHHVTSVEQERSGEGGSGSSIFIEAIPADTQWYSLPTVPRPVVKGPETAIVTGPKGEKIYTDKYGRVKVRFHWDRGATDGEASTCWIRVSQTGGLGNIILPRVGHEVIVDFLYGDPDRPIVVGRVFNSKNMPIYPLPDNKTRALWRTERYGAPGSYDGAESLDTGAPGVNELRFEDKGGAEEVFLHAERDMNVRVRNKASQHIGLDQEIKVGQDRTDYVKRNEAVTIDGGRDAKIKESDALDVKKDIKINSGTTIAIEAKSKITLTVGSSTITIDPTSVKIDATMVQISGQATAEMKSPMTTVKGDGILTLKGGITLIN
jgi:type VI secretion system secreted protein VgrG